ncbi:MAG: deoxyuridine 5'-triphosphate nucleotidohydrolase [Dehalococcoidia bacterium]|nr:deoxyuridine 5'-triphosphate nucleotidohydrolase [Dehalococcoidia bacterium]
MSILSRDDILSLVTGDPPLVENYLDLEMQLQTNGFDISLRSISRLTSCGRLAQDNKERMISTQQKLEFAPDGTIHLDAGSYSITYNEIVHLPKDVTALGLPRSSLLRCGACIHTAVWDAGYHGRSESLLVVHNALGLDLEKDARVLQLVFSRLTGSSPGYAGAYQSENIT